MTFTLRQHHLIAGTVSTVFIAIGFAVVLLGFRDAGNLLVIHFEAGRGIDYFGTRTDMVAIAGAGAAMAFMNIALARSLVRRLPLAGFLVAYGNVLFSLLLLIGLMGILAVN